MEHDRQLVARALSRDASACRALVERLTPLLQVRVTRVLVRRHARGGARFSRAEIIDLVQEVFVLLLDRDGRILRAWDPERGMSLENFVGLVAEREVSAFLESGRRSAWAEQPTDELLLHASSNEVSARKARATTPESHVDARQQLQLVLERLRARLTPRGFAFFDALVVKEMPVDEVAELYATTPSALYSFRNRLRQEVDAIRAELDETAGYAKLQGAV